MHQARSPYYSKFAPVFLCSLCALALPLFKSSRECSVARQQSSRSTFCLRDLPFKLPANLLQIFSSLFPLSKPITSSPKHSTTNIQQPTNRNPSTTSHHASDPEADGVPRSRKLNPSAWSYRTMLTVLQAWQCFDTEPKVRTTHPMPSHPSHPFILENQPTQPLTSPRSTTTDSTNSPASPASPAPANSCASRRTNSSLNTAPSEQISKQPTPASRRHPNPLPATPSKGSPTKTATPGKKTASSATPASRKRGAGKKSRAEVEDDSEADGEGESPTKKVKKECDAEEKGGEADGEGSD